MKKIVFDGQVYAQRLTGQYRYADELLKELDKIIKKDEFEIIIPNYVNIEGKFKNLKVIHYGNVKGLLWTQTSLAMYLIRFDAISLNFCNITTILKPGIAAILDISYKSIRDNYCGIYGNLSSLWHRFFYTYIAFCRKKIITLSEFSKRQISDYYHVDKNRITIIGCGWQHYDRIKEDDGIFFKYNWLKKKDYFLSLGSLEVRKNFKYVEEIAKRNPSKVFVVIGGKVKNSGKNGKITESDNLFYLGFVNDEEAKSLMRYAKAFIFPSTFEGFGLPPLEALSVGTPCVCANTTSLPEVYGNSVHYVDPYEYNVDLDTLLSEKVEDSSLALQKYSWENSAKKLYDFLKSYKL